MRQVPEYFLNHILTSIDAGCSVGVTLSCDDNAGKVCEYEVEEFFDRPGTTKGT